MGRRKLTMKSVQNRNARRALFERRKKGLLKKASELSTLCGIDACVIIFPPPDSENPKAETFPQDPRRVIRNIQQYNANKECPQKQRKSYDLREFFNDRKTQVEAQTSRVREQRSKMSSCPTWDDSFHNLGEDQLRMFIAALDSKLEECNQTIGSLKAKKSEIPVVPMGLEIPVTVIPPHDVSDKTHLGSMQNMNDQWIWTPLLPLQDISNQSHLGFQQITTQEDNLVIPRKPLADSSSNGLTDSYCLGEDQLRMFIAALDYKHEECNQTIGFVKAKKSEFPVVPMHLEIPVTVIPPHDVSDKTYLVSMQNMSDKANVVSLDDKWMCTALLPLQDISNQSHFGFQQITTQEDNLVIPRKPLADSSGNGLTDSYCLEDQMLDFGLENFDLDMFMGLECDQFDPIVV